MISFVGKHKQFPDAHQRSESAALLPRTEVQTLTYQIYEARETSEHFHNLGERNLEECRRIIVERDGAPLEERALLRKDEEERKNVRRERRKLSKPKKEPMDAQGFLQDYIPGQYSGRSIPSHSDGSVPVAWEETKTTFCFSRNGKLLAQ